jgi:hypothetical protein
MWINRDADNHIVGFDHGLTSARIAVATGPASKAGDTRSRCQPGSVSSLRRCLTLGLGFVGVLVFMI